MRHNRYNLECILCLFDLGGLFTHLRVPLYALLDDIRGDFKYLSPFGQMELWDKIHPAFPKTNLLLESV
jgi:hypothetical protein